ncbi:MAG: S8 family serine peptidase [Halobacteriovoraceae bacterium]|nr:S8 family serine peptidase [Halobacteriovoraceae bacterium]
MLKLSLILSFIFIQSLSAFSAIVGIVDSGVDYQHVMLESLMWQNPGEIPGNRRDDDNNKYRDDVYGWNVPGENGEVINYKYLDTFTDKPFRYLELQTKKIIGTITQAEETEMEALRADPDFIKEMGIFGNFAHGTHVSGIVSQFLNTSELMAVKLLPTEPGELQGLLRWVYNESMKVQEIYAGKDYAGVKKSVIKEKKMKVRDTLMRKAFDMLAELQTGMLESAFSYVGTQEVRVVNGSFGTSYHAIKKITDLVYLVLFQKKPNDEQSLKTASIFFKMQLNKLSSVLNKYPNTLFVFAAGNDGSNNDIYPASPANVNLPNVITVGATIDYVKLAKFSNFGEKLVDLAAPGVGIVSSVPTGTHSDVIQMSGTSMAAPFVTGVAARIVEENPELTSEQVKEILIGTIDSKENLNGKLKHAGIVNDRRAIVAARLSQNVSVENAIARAQSSTSDKVPQIEVIEKDEENEQLLGSEFNLIDLSPEEEKELEKSVREMVDNLKKKE